MDKNFYLIRIFKAILIIQESLMTISEDWQMAFRYLTLPDKNCMCHNFPYIEYKPSQNMHSDILLAVP